MNAHALIPNGAGLRLLVATPDAPDGLAVDVSAQTDADGGVFLHLEPIGCNLEGEQPGDYYPTPLA